MTGKSATDGSASRSTQTDIGNKPSIDHGTLPADSFAPLLSGFVGSKAMIAHLSQCELTVTELAEIVLGAPVPLEKKAIKRAALPL